MTNAGMFLEVADSQKARRVQGLELDSNVRYLKGVGEKRAKCFQKLDVETVWELLHFYPRSYLDFSSPAEISSLTAGENCCIKAFVLFSPTEHRIRKDLTIFKTVVSDGTGKLTVNIFNSSFQAKKLTENNEYFFIGKVTAGSSGPEMSNPTVKPADSDEPFSPIYPQTAGLNSNRIAQTIRNAVKFFSELPSSDVIPDTVRRENQLCHELYAIKNIHFPTCEKDIEIARRRLVFEELFVLQAGMLVLRRKNREKTSAFMPHDYTGRFISSLPFTLTGAQKRAVTAIAEDMKRDIPMNRLIQGDVGSGKTVVAAAVMYSAVKNGFQCAFMAPTELLAVQHRDTLQKMMPDDIRVGLLTGSVTAANKKKLKERIKNGEADIVVGTHALLTDDVAFSSLGLVVTDEQHRFGVRQRGILSDKGENPHVLIMSATPIPRTLSLMIYGELDISVIDELPKGRKSIKTYCVDSSYKPRVYNFIKKHLDKGLQAYMVCPLVEQNESSRTAAADYAEKLQNTVFSGYSVGLLHGKMKPKEKKKVMQDFADGKIGLLVSTTVIEVGIDVPNAVLMVIEDADCFGLSQLHQLRGRVGRGSEQSYCVLISNSQSEKTKQRLGTLCQTNDGFKIADADLKLRGPGDFFGSRQHGLPKLRIADLLEDMITVKKAQQAAKSVIGEDETLSMPKNAALKKAVERLFSQTNTTTLN